MGTDNLFHKRKTKNAAALKRRAVKRETYAKILIFCEGIKTEPNYFNDIRDFYGLNTANVEVCGECGSDPMSIVRYAKRRYRQEKDAGDAFDKVFCVFDKDGHANYAGALAEINSATPRDTYIAINSVPCFEYWLLLHYGYSTRPYKTLPGNSACNQVLSELRAYMPGYQKGADKLFSALVDRVEDAKKNAVRSLSDAARTGADNPTTRVHELVEFMQKIREP